MRHLDGSLPVFNKLTNRQMVNGKMAILRRHRVRGILWVAVIVVAGCGPSTSETAKVRGTVTLDGKPLTQGIIKIIPERGRAGKGRLQTDGSFIVMTYEDGDGARVGPAAVTVTAATGGTHEGEERQWIAPSKFTNPSSSGLTCDIAAGTENVLEITLSSDGSGSVWNKK